jgi:hypothetical protein
MNRGALRAISLLLPTIVGCAADGPGEWVEADGYRWRDLRPTDPTPAGFAQLDPARLGIAFVNSFGEESLLDNDALADGAGVAFGDFDDDGLPDLYLTSIDGPNALYRNLGDWRFEDVTGAAGVALDGSVSRAAAWADVDADDDLDLLVTRHSETNVLFRNDGDGRFTDVSAEWGFDASYASHSQALADVDGDGDLDLYVTNYKDRWARDVFPPAERQFDRITQGEGDELTIRPEYRDHYRLVDTPNGLSRWEFAEPDEFYLNEGGRFVRVPFTDPRFRGEDGRPLAAEPDEWGLAVRFADLDGDGDADIYVCNDINSPDHLWVNDGRGGFTLIDPLAIRKTSASSMAVDVADVDRDGHVDLFVAEMLAPDLRQRHMQVPEIDTEPSRPGEIDNRPQVTRNTLQLNRGDGTFAETAFESGVAASGWNWGALFLDVDLDGYEDLVLTNGHVFDLLDGDTRDQMQGNAAGPDWHRQKLQFPVLRQQNMAFRNRGDGTFADATAAWGVGSDPDIAHGLAAADLDADGDLDVIVNRLDAPPLVLRNEASGPRVAVRVRPSGPNTRGIGARVRVSFDDLPEQMDEVAAGGLYLSDSDGLLSFAAGDAAGTLEVRWTDGQCTRIDGIAANREYVVLDEAAGRTPCADVSPVDPTPPVRFEDRTEDLSHTHYEEVYVDEFSRQPLVVHRLAQLGPGVSWIDHDADGFPDLWIGSGRGGRISRFINRGGRLTGTLATGVAAGDISTILPAPGAGLAIAGQMNYEAADPTTGLALPSVLSVSDAGAVPMIEGALGATGPMTAADVNGDGALDLFVGGRVIPTAYPIPPSSRLYLGSPAGPALDPANTRALEGIGLASGAAFSDIDADGDPDLLIALEWGSIRVFENDSGRLTDASATWGVDGLLGRWNGVATGDLDSDGLPDLVVTAWGDNTEAALNDGPAAALYGDFDRNGVLDIIELAIDASGQERPALRLGQLGRGLPYIRRVAANNQAFVATPMSELFGPGLSEAARVEATELRHLVLMNRGGRFEATPLPAEAQRAPAFGVAIADFDADGHEDVILAQNHFATRLETPRYDAGRGLLLTGDGTGTLTVETDLPFHYGDGRGLAIADYDADGRIDVAIGQNGGPTRLWRNDSDGRGLRLRLTGPSGNERGIGTAVRVEYAGGVGPIREIQAGSGYWSSNGTTQVFGLSEEPVALRIRWPDGEETRIPVPPGAREVSAAHPAAAGGSTR